MKRSLPGLLVGLTMLLGAPHVNSALLHFDAFLDGPAWLPAVVNTPATGNVNVDIDTAAHTMAIHVAFSGLRGNTTASHIHCCTTTPLTGIVGVATTTPTFAGFPLGVTSGSYDRILDLTLASSFNPAFVTAQGGSVAAAEAALIQGMLDGRAYLVVHSTFRPAGEIRGFLPEPGTLALLPLGLGAALLLRRRRVA